MESKFKLGDKVSISGVITGITNDLDFNNEPRTRYRVSDESGFSIGLITEESQITKKEGTSE